MKKNKAIKILIFVFLYFIGTKLFVSYAYQFRGYTAIGAEWILMLVILFGLPQIIRWISECIEYSKESNNDDNGVDKNDL